MKVDFWSSSEYGGFLLGLIRELRHAGVQTAQRFHIKAATYRKSQGRCARMWLRFRQYVVYPIDLAGHLVWGRLTGRGADVVVVCTNTFYAPLLATWLHPRVVHLVYDLYPEALMHAGKLRAQGRTVRALRWLTARTMQRAQLNVFLGDRLLHYAQSTYAWVPRALVIPVGADQALFAHAPQHRVRPEGAHGTQSGSQTAPALPRSRPTILYCGNIGNMHDSATLFSLWRDYAESADHVERGAHASVLEPVAPAKLPNFHFCCSGPQQTALEAAHAALPPALQARIEVSGSLADAAWVEAMEAADVALVTMVPGSETVLMPSKAYSAMMAGQALLVVAPEASCLVDLVKRSGAGWWVEPGDVAGLAQAVDAIASQPEEIQSCLSLKNSRCEGTGILQSHDRAYVARRAGSAFSARARRLKMTCTPVAASHKLLKF